MKIHPNILLVKREIPWNPNKLVIFIGLVWTTSSCAKIAKAIVHSCLEFHWNPNTDFVCPSSVFQFPNFNGKHFIKIQYNDVIAFLLLDKQQSGK